MSNGETPVALLLFAKAPVPGRVKTRLSRTVGDAVAAEIAAALLADTVRRFSGLPGIELWLHGDHPDPEPYRSTLATVPPYRPQTDGPLGLRLRDAFAAPGPVPAPAGVIAIGSDAPHLPTEWLLEAAHAVRAGSAVLGPASDGGFTLIGLPEGVSGLEGLFPDDGWSEPGVLERTRRAFRGMRRAGRPVPVRELPPLRDVDDWQDLLHLARKLRDDASLGDLCPRTAAVLARVATEDPDAGLPAEHARATASRSAESGRPGRESPPETDVEGR